MSAPRRDRLEAHLATRWQRYAAVTGSALALAGNASLPSLGAGLTDSTANASPCSGRSS